MSSFISFKGLTTLFVAEDKKKKKSIKKNKNKSKKKENLSFKKERNPRGFSNSAKRAIRTITFSPYTNPVGSYKYKVHSYPSDIDIFEVYKECCSLVKMQKNVANKLSQIGRNIKKNKLMFLADFKCGIDHDMYFDFGEIDYMDKIKIINYDYNILNVKLNQFRERKWITNEEYNELRLLAKKDINVENFIKIYDKIRSFYLCRWNLDELIKGDKILRSGKKINLEEAITHDSIIKIDIWAPVNGNYKEITNIYYLILEDKNKNELILNKKLSNYVESLTKDISKYASPKFRNSLKVAKRMYIKNNLLKKIEKMKKLYPLFYSGIALINQIKEEMVVISEMIELTNNDKKSDINKNFVNVLKIIKSQIDKFKNRLNNVFDVNFNESKIYSLLDKSYKTKNNLELKKYIDECINILKVIIEENTRKYLIDNNLIKLPKTKNKTFVYEEDDYYIIN